MKLQLALDVLNLEEVSSILDEVAEYFDVIEAGTTLIKKEGIRAVTEIKKHCPQTQVLADLKIIDAGELEARMAFEAGADLVTVLALATDSTIRGVINRAHRENKQVMVDLIAIHDDVARRSRQVDELGADYVCVHTGLDMQRQGMTPLKELKYVSPLPLQSAKTCVAGGINPETLPKIMAYHPEIVVVGGFITNSDNKRKAAQEIKQIAHDLSSRHLGGKIVDFVKGVLGGKEEDPARPAFRDDSDITAG